MNNVFKILWFEDNENWFKMEKKKIDRILDENFLIPKIDLKKNAEGIDISSLLTNQYDLILMDYKLKDGFTGDGIIKSIRNNNFLTDILFYSSDFDNMNKTVRNAIPEIDGIYITKRDNKYFSEKVMRLIYKIIKRSEDLISLRGIIIDCTSTFEAQIQKILDNLWTSTKIDRKESLKNILTATILPNKIKWTNKKIESGSSLSFQDTNNDCHCLSMADRLDIIDNIASIESLSSISNIKDFYMKKIGSIRNQLGHLEVGNTVKLNGQHILINEDFCKLIRKNIKEISELISSLPNALNIESPY